MVSVPDAPYIRDAERYGTDYMYSYVYGIDIDELDDDEPEENERRLKLCPLKYPSPLRIMSSSARKHLSSRSSSM